MDEDGDVMDQVGVRRAIPPYGAGPGTINKELEVRRLPDCPC